MSGTADTRHFFNSVQILTGDIPFRNLRQAELVIAVVRGERPEKTENASEIGFSDSLWDFAQLCWDCDRKQRPKVAQVAERLREAAANWLDPMPPRVRRKPATPTPKGEELDHCEFEMSIFLRFHPLSNDTDPILERQTNPDRLSSQLSDPTPETEGSGRPHSLSTQSSDPVQEVEIPDRQGVLSTQCNDLVQGEPDIDGPLKRRPNFPPMKRERSNLSPLDTFLHSRRLQGWNREGVNSIR